MAVFPAYLQEGAKISYCLHVVLNDVLTLYELVCVILSTSQNAPEEVSYSAWREDE